MTTDIVTNFRQLMASSSCCQRMEKSYLYPKILTDILDTARWESGLCYVCYVLDSHDSHSRWIWSDCQSQIFSIKLMLTNLDPIFQGKPETFVRFDKITTNFSRSGSSSTSTSVSSSPSHAIAYSPASSCDDNMASPGPGSFSQSSQDAKGPRWAAAGQFHASFGFNLTVSKFCRRSFYIRVKEKPLSRGDRAQYQHMHLVGHNSRRSNMAVFVGVMRPVRDRWERIVT